MTMSSGQVRNMVLGALAVLASCSSFDEHCGELVARAGAACGNVTTTGIPELRRKLSAGTAADATAFDHILRTLGAAARRCLTAAAADAPELPTGPDEAAAFLAELDDRMHRVMDLEHHGRWARYFDCPRARVMLRDNCTQAATTLSRLEESVRSAAARGSLPAYGGPVRDIAESCLGAEQSTAIGTLAVEYSELALVLPTAPSSAQRERIARDAERLIAQIRSIVETARQ
jgi:hypothetical protein